MMMRRSAPYGSILGTACALLLGEACTLLVNDNGAQCATDRDCRRFSSAAVCVRGGCRLPNADGGAVPDGPPGCFSGTPTTTTQFLNRCTTATYLPFDNCARLGLCADGGYDPDALETPPTVDAGATTSMPATQPSVACYDANARSKPIFIQGSTNFTGFIRALAPVIAQRGYTIVWQPTSSCAGAGAGGFDPAPGKNEMRNPTTTAQTPAAFYDASGNVMPCALGNSPAAPEPGVGEATDIGESDVFAASCGGNSNWIPGSAQFPNVGHYLGPIQPMVLATPPASTQRVISAEAAHMIFGQGGKNGTVKPWIDPTFMWIRSWTTGTNNIVSRGIDVPPTQWWGLDKRTTLAMHDALLTVSVADAERTIGTLSSDATKDGVRALFFQARGQIVGFLPDSSPAAHDNQNVRDGHYPLWGPIHLYARTSGGQPSSAASAFVIPFSTPNRALLDASVAGGMVPICAMSVTRDTEMGPLRSFVPDFQCECYYELKVRGETQCKACAGPADCPPATPACNFGYCESR